MMQTHPALGGYLGNGWAYRTAPPEVVAGAPGAEGLMASVNVGGLEMNGRVSAAFIGAIVIGFGAFYLVTRGIQF